MTRVLSEVFQVIPVIECDFLASSDQTFGHKPNMAVNQLRVAIGRATVIKPPGLIRCDAAVQILSFIEIENKPNASLAAPERLGFVDLLTLVFDDPSPR